MAQRMGAGGMMTFGAIFLAIGGVMATMSVRTLLRAEAMRGWTEAPATVVSCDLRTSRGSKGGTSYRVEATYQYEAGGVRHTSSRVSLHSGSDNIGRFHQRAYAELKRCQAAKVPTVCWVNPKDPAEAILFRKPRLELMAFMQLFVLGFGGAGLAFVLSGVAGLFRRPDAEPSSGLGQIRMRGVSWHRVAGALALAWNGYVAFYLWKAWLIMSPEGLPWHQWLMAASGLAPAAVAGYLIGRIRKFGVSVFEMSPLPGVLGGPVAGTIRIPAHVDATSGFELVLQCVHQYTSGSGKQRSTHRDVLWEESRHFDAGLAYGDETMLPVRFLVPYEKPATTVPGGCDGYYWRLTATAAAPGIDYKAAFDVPVRHTPQSSPSAVPQPVAEAKQEPAQAVAAREGLRLEPRPGGGFELVFPPARALPATLFLLLFVAGWTGVCVLLWTVSKAPVFMAAVFTLADLVLMGFLLSSLLVTRGVLVDRQARECVVWWQAPGLARRERRLPFGAILEARSERAGQSGDTVYYRVVLAADGGLPVTVGSGMKMWNDAEDIAKLLWAGTRPAFELEGFRV